MDDIERITALMREMGSKVLTEAITDQCIELMQKTGVAVAYGALPRAVLMLQGMPCATLTQLLADPGSMPGATAAELKCRGANIKPATTVTYTLLISAKVGRVEGEERSEREAMLCGMLQTTVQAVGQLIHNWAEEDGDEVETVVRKDPFGNN